MNLIYAHRKKTGHYPSVNTNLTRFIMVSPQENEGQERDNKHWWEMKQKSTKSVQDLLKD